jgi:uncharacterized protein (DUF2267 family)
MAVLSDIIAWLRKGYPEGVPDGDYIPLFALLGRHLTDGEVKEIAEQLSSKDTHSSETIHAAINAVTRDTRRDTDIDRVRARLAAGGWPLANPGTGGNPDGQ